MTRSEIEQAYSINARGVICTPGKFEGEQVWAPAIYDIVLDGFGETFSWPDDESIFDIVDCDDDLRALFPEIDKNTVAFSVEYSDSGFVYVTQMSAQVLENVQKQNADAWEKADA